MFFKRLFDIIFSSVGIVILLPVWVVIIILVMIDSKGPVFYRQIRVGKNFKKFKIIKFRTMIENADTTGNFITADDDARITRIGYYLRKLKLDEFPQLINVLIGDMSLVGPRPEVVKYVDHYQYNRILYIRPGITDFASIKYRNEDEILYNMKKQGINIENYYKNIILKDKIEINLKYLKNMSFFSDLFIIIKTIFYLNKDNKSLFR